MVEVEKRDDRPENKYHVGALSRRDYHAIIVQRHYAERYTKQHIHRDTALYQSAVTLLVQQVEADTPYR